MRQKNTEPSRPNFLGRSILSKNAMMRYMGLLLMMFITASIGWHFISVGRAQIPSPSRNNPVIAIALSSNRVRVSWLDTSGGANHYRIQKKGGVGTSEGTTTQTVVTDRVSPGNYQYTVYAVNAKGLETLLGNTSVTVASTTAVISTSVASSIPVTPARANTISITGASANTLPPLSGTITLIAVAPSDSTVTYQADGKPINPILNTTRLADGDHIISALVTESNGQVLTKEQTLRVNNHHSIIRNLMLRYGTPVVATGVIVIVLSLLGITMYTIRFMYRTFKGTMPPPPNISLTNMPTILPPAPYL